MIQVLAVFPMSASLPLASVLGLVAYASLAALGAWKNINAQVWFLACVKLAVTIALVLDITQVVLTLSINTRGNKCIPDIFHLHTLCLRVLLGIAYNHVERQRESATAGEESTPPQEDGPIAGSSKYGTFATQDQCESGSPPAPSGVKEAPSKRKLPLTNLRRLGCYGGFNMIGGNRDQHNHLPVLRCGVSTRE
ncbi:hypothetical protein F5141DRAFT_1287919 [Pisolithus sp. B1]|nr:hypothetical protein F5141DRAFT_1287919 [Pisolithus sp. B1]